MAKKIIVLTLLMSLMAGFVVAQAATDTATVTTTTVAIAKPAAGPTKPAVSIDFSQRFDAETIGGVIVDNILQDTDPLYSRSEIGAKVAFDLGGGFKIAPWAKDRFEGKFNSGDLTTKATVTGATLDTGLEALGSIRFRNRFYTGIDFTLALDKALNIGLNTELRVASDLRTDKAFTGNDALIERRFAPILSVSGKIDDFGYSLTQAFNNYFDKNTDSKNEYYTEWEGTYNVNYTIKLDNTMGLKIDLTNGLTITNPTMANLDNMTLGEANPYLAQVINVFTPKFTLVTGDFNPFVGFLWDIDLNNGNAKKTKLAGESTYSNVIGGTLGADFKVGNATLGVSYSLGAEQATGATKDLLVSQSTVSIKIKG